MEIPAEWRGILRRGERILWQGAPRRAFFWRKSYTAAIFASAVMLVIGLIISEDALTFWLILAIALGTAVGPMLLDSHRRKHSFFTLTDRNAFIGIDSPLLGRRLDRYPIDASTKVQMAEHTPLHAVYFAHRVVKTRHGEREEPVGFESLDWDDARRVHGLIEDVRKPRA